MKPTDSTLSSPTADGNLLARADFCQGDFQHLVLNSRRHILRIYLMRQLEDTEHLIRYFLLERSSFLRLFHDFLLLGADNQPPRLGQHFHVLTRETGDFGCDLKPSICVDDR